MKRGKTFAKSKLANVVREIIKLPRRPSEVIGIEGSPLDMLLWDMAIMNEGKPTGPRMDPKIIDKMKFPSVKDRIRARRKALGIV